MTTHAALVIIARFIQGIEWYLAGAMAVQALVLALCAVSWACDRGSQRRRARRLRNIRHNP